MRGDVTKMEKEFEKQIGQRIRQRRIDLGLSLQDISDMSGISKSTLQRYETGSIRNLPFQRLDALARALRTSKQWFFGTVDDVDDISPVDMDFIKLLDSLGYEISSRNLVKSRIYFSRYPDCPDGSLPDEAFSNEPISREEYLHLRDTVVSYIKLNADNLLSVAHDREKLRFKNGLMEIDLFNALLKTDEGKRLLHDFNDSQRKEDQ